MSEQPALCAMCHHPLEGMSADPTDIGMMHSDPYTYDECSCYDAYIGGAAPDRAHNPELHSHPEEWPPKGIHSHPGGALPHTHQTSVTHEEVSSMYRVPADRIPPKPNTPGVQCIAIYSGSYDVVGMGTTPESALMAVHSAMLTAYGDAMQLSCREVEESTNFLWLSPGVAEVL